MRWKIKSLVFLSTGLAVGLFAILYAISFSEATSTNSGALIENDAEQPVILKGKLVLKVFPGPPEYSSIEEGDRADDCWTLQLDRPSSLIVAGKIPALERAYGLSGTVEESCPNEVLLVLDEHARHFCQKHGNKTVLSEGSLFLAHTAHHYTPFLMAVKKCWGEEE